MKSFETTSDEPCSELALLQSVFRHLLFALSSSIALFSCRRESCQAAKREAARAENGGSVPAHPLIRVASTGSDWSGDRLQAEAIVVSYEKYEQSIRSTASHGLVLSAVGDSRGGYTGSGEPSARYSHCFLVLCRERPVRCSSFRGRPG